MWSSSYAFHLEKILVEMLSKPAISIVMPCHNRSYDLIKTLQAYDAQLSQEPFELIAIDDASEDGTCKLLTSYEPINYSLRIGRNERNMGPATARNLGVSLADAPIILFVGDDIVPHPRLVSGHLLAHRIHSKREIAILGRVMWANDLPVNTLMTHIDGVGAQQFSFYYLKDGKEYDYRHLYTANVSLKREFLTSQEKLFDTDFQYAAFEDAELGYRLFKAGLSIIYLSLLIGFHYHYHNIWTFSERMYRAGLMACLLVQKHPETRLKILGRNWSRRLASWKIKSAFQTGSLEQTLSIEEQILQLSSNYEWSSHPLLDELYLKVLTCYFFKGVIYGIFKNTPTAIKIHNQCVNEFLVPLVNKLMQESERLGMKPNNAL